jgi:hypothetical protein
MLGKLSKYLGIRLLEEHFILPQLGGSYLLGFALDFWKKGVVMLNPTWFLPILATSFVIFPIFTKVRGSWENKKLKIRRKQEAYYEKIKDAHSAIKALFINPSVNKEGYVEAWEKISLVHVELLEKREKAVPKEELDPNDRDSVIVWYKFLVNELARNRREKENA